MYPNRPIPAARVFCVLALMCMPLVAQGPRFADGPTPRSGSTRGVHAIGGSGAEGTAAGAPEFDPNWTTAGLVLLIGGAILLAGSRRRERLAD